MRNLIKAVFFILFIANNSNALVEICGDGIDQTLAHTFGACPSGWVDSKIGVGCDMLCGTPDRDNDGAKTAVACNNDVNYTDCDDTDPFIYPGVTTTKGCTGGQLRTCQNNGTYTACSSTPYCPSSCLTCKYISTTGNNSNAGTFASPWLDQTNFNTRYSNDEPNPATAGTCYIFRGGTYSTTRLYNADTVGLFFRNKNGTALNPIQILGYPGETVIFDYPGTSGTKISPIQLYTVSHFAIKDIILRNNYLGSNVVSAEGAIAIEAGSNITTQRVIANNNEGAGGANVAGLVLNGGDNLIADHNIFVDNQQATANPNSAGVVVFRGNNHLIKKNITGYTGVTRMGDGIKKKHTNYNETIEISENTVFNTLEGIVSAGAGTTIKRNRIFENDLGIGLFDLGGPNQYHLASLIEYNTLYNNSNSNRIEPELGWNINNTASADRCSSNSSINTITFNKNVIVMNRATLAQDFNFLDVGTYDPDFLYGQFITGGKLISNNNCWHASVAPSPYWGLYESNNGNLTCSGRGNNGASYTSFSAWQATGRDAQSFYKNPLFDNQFRALDADCKDKGWRTLDSNDSGQGLGCSTHFIVQ